MMESHQDAPLQDLFEILRLEMSLHSFTLDDPQPVAGSHPAQHRAPGSIQLHPTDSNRAPMPGHGVVPVRCTQGRPERRPSAVTSVNQLPGAARRVGGLVGNEVLRLCALLLLF